MFGSSVHTASQICSAVVAPLPPPPPHTHHRYPAHTVLVAVKDSADHIGRPASLTGLEGAAQQLMTNEGYGALRTIGFEGSRCAAAVTCQYFPIEISGVSE